MPGVSRGAHLQKWQPACFILWLGVEEWGPILSHEARGLLVTLHGLFYSQVPQLGVCCWFLEIMT